MPNWKLSAFETKSIYNQLNAITLKCNGNCVGKHTLHFYSVYYYCRIMRSVFCVCKLILICELTFKRKIKLPNDKLLSGICSKNAKKVLLNHNDGVVFRVQ